MAEHLRLGPAAAFPQQATQGARACERGPGNPADQAVGDQPAGRVQRLGPDRPRAVAKNEVDQRALGSRSTLSAMISRWISELPAAIVSTQDHMKS